MPAKSHLCLEVRNLKKHYSKNKAVDGVSFSVPAGTCFGLLGPNGAGKTTTIEMIEGIIDATSGSILYEGKALDSAFRERIGIMFQSTALQDFVTVREVLVMFASFYKESTPVDVLVQKCHLEDFLDQDCQKLSGGQKQRLLLAMALVNNPMIVFLDEPTTGLDPQARRNLWDLVNEIKSMGTTIILTTHYMDEAYQLSDEIAIMDKGKIIAQGSPDELLTKHFDDTVIEVPVVDFDLQVKFGFAYEQKNDIIYINTTDVQSVLGELILHKISLSNLQLRKKGLEDLFIELTGKALR